MSPIALKSKKVFLNNLEAHFFSPSIVEESSSESLEAHEPVSLWQNCQHFPCVLYLLIPGSRKISLNLCC
jgi:hypothetical protein